MSYLADMRTRTIITTAALAIGGLTTACQPTSDAHADVLRVDCTQPGYFSVQTSATAGELELQTGTGDVVWEGPAADVQRSTVRDWHPTRGGHIKVLRAVLDASYASPKSTTPTCGVVLEPETSDVEA